MYAKIVSPESLFVIGSIITMEPCYAVVVIQELSSSPTFTTIDYSSRVIHTRFTAYAFEGVVF